MRLPCQFFRVCMADQFPIDGMHEGAFTAARDH